MGNPKNKKRHGDTSSIDETLVFPSKMGTDQSKRNNNNMTRVGDVTADATMMIATARRGGAIEYEAQ